MKKLKILQTTKPKDDPPRYQGDLTASIVHFLLRTIIQELVAIAVYKRASSMEKEDDAVSRTTMLARI